MSEQRFRIPTRKISLAFMGEGYEDAYFETRRINVADQRRIFEQLDGIGGDDSAKAYEVAQDVLQQQFYGGVMPNMEGELVPFSADDIPTIFDLDAVMTIYAQVMGNPDPKASKSSTISTPEEPTKSPEVAPSSDTAEISDSQLSSLNESQPTPMPTG